MRLPRGVLLFLGLIFTALVCLIAYKLYLQAGDFAEGFRKLFGG